MTFRLGYRFFSAILAACFLSACSPEASRFKSEFARAPDRMWIGPEYYANRLMDWRIREGRLETLEGRQSKPMRTVHLLTRYLSDSPGELIMSVRTGAVDDVDHSVEHTWTGFLLGAGGPDIDFRISVLVHHWSARGGGLFVGVDGTGKIIMRDNEYAESLNGPRGDYSTADWPLIEPTSVSGKPTPIRDFRLRVRAFKKGSGYTLEVESLESNTNKKIGFARYTNVPAHYLSGTVALVSHLSPSAHRESAVESGSNPDIEDAGDGPQAGYWFQDWRVSGSKVVHSPERAFGPVMGTQYTLSRRTLKMTAQMGPLGENDTGHASLELFTDQGWDTAAKAAIHHNGYTATFRVDDWNSSEDVAYRVAYDLVAGGKSKTHYFTGVIRSRPRSDEEFILGALNCQNVSGGDGSWTHNHIWYPHSETSAAVDFHDPDMLFFAGDQIYEGGISGIVRSPTDDAIIDYLYHWYRFVWAFRDLMRDRPTVTIPDDHDVYHGNIWGEGGKAATGSYSPASDNGGYIMAPEFVNAVHRTQSSHLPDPYDSTPIDQDISVYYTDLTYGGVSFGIVSDRMFKSAPRALLPDAEVWNGWPQNKSFNAAKDADSDEFILLGQRQLTFLDHWAQEWEDDTWMKVLLSQTVFNNVATIPASEMSGASIPSLPLPDIDEVVTGDKFASDMDSGGWPRSGRDRALRIIRRARAFHVVGDQHLGSVVQYGIDDFNDAGYAFVVPSIANIWPRRWFPPSHGANRAPESSWYTGEFIDGFGSKMTVHAAANPLRSLRAPEALNDRVPGYGIVRMNRASRNVRFEAWPRWVDPALPGAMMYADWPVVFNQVDNDRRKAAGMLMLESAVPAGTLVSVYYDDTGEHVYTDRLRREEDAVAVYDENRPHRVVIDRAGGARSTYRNLEFRMAPDARR